MQYQQQWRAYNTARMGRGRRPTEVQMGQRRSVDTRDDTWWIQIKCMFSGMTSHSAVWHFAVSYFTVSHFLGEWLGLGLGFGLGVRIRV